MRYTKTPLLYFTSLYSPVSCCLLVGWTVQMYTHERWIAELQKPLCVPCWLLHKKKPGPIFLPADSMLLSSFTLTRWTQINAKNGKLMAHYDRSRSSKVVAIGTNWQPVCDFLLANNSNLSLLSHRLRDIATKASESADFTPVFHSGFSPVICHMKYGLETSFWATRCKNRIISCLNAAGVWLYDGHTDGRRRS